MSAFLAALRLSRREALRAKGRTALVMVMIGLPVLVFTALLTYDATVDVAPGEDITAELGAADARIVTTAHDGRVTQPVHGRFSLESGSSARDAAVRSADEVTALLDARLIPYDVGSVEIRDTDRYQEVSALELDLRDPMTHGIRLLTEGRFPASAGEVAVTPALARELGLRVGDTITVTARDRRVRVVGVVEHPHNLKIREVVGLQHTLLLDKRGGHGPGWLADSARPVLWEDVRRLNGVGMLVTSRAVLTGPPVAGAYGDPLKRALGTPALMTLAAMVVLVVMEMALLTGPAFAVGLRRRRRELALIAAQGGSARHLKAIVLADGLVLGGVAALLGAALGTGGTLALMPLLKRLLGPSGPVDVPWGPVLGVTALGVAGALVAALVPAVSAARQDPACVLADRENNAGDNMSDSAAAGAAPRGARRGVLAGSRRARLPVVAVLLLVGGLAATVYALRRGRSYGALADAFLLPAGVLVVLGLVALIPAMVTALGGFAARLPLPLRLAVRDAARHRTRTASAAAAVMAATMGAFTLGIGVESSITAALMRYRAEQPPDTLRIAARQVDDRGWADLRAAAAKALPGVPLVPAGKVFDGEGRAVQLVAGPEKPRTGELFVDPSIGDARLLAFLQGRPDPRAVEALTDGKAVVFNPALLHNGILALHLSANGRGGGSLVRIPAVVAVPSDPRRIGVVVPPAVLEKAGYTVAERVLYTTHRSADLRRLQRQLSLPTARADVAALDVEVPSTLGMFWWVFGLALVLSLGGTFAATGLAAADLRRDLDIVSAVGGSPRTRRAILAAQAGFIAGIGALVGAVGGAVMGAALAVPLTRRDLPPDGLEPAVFTVPWTATALVVLGAPLLAVLLAGLLTRSRQAPPGRRFA
ncbi:FtsX-like permease family protein [Nonomuraea sp. CA-218870]|uniref:ABC transporter permease n=1 Tax=Nonomuraea sp. CA-218870 TaxID=3239998 RepID=UPI003D936CE9